MGINIHSNQEEEQSSQTVFHIKRSGHSTRERAGDATVTTVSPHQTVPPAYVLERVRTQEQDSRAAALKTFLNTPEDLRAGIELASGKIWEDGLHRPLFVLHGLPVEFIKAVRSCIDIDPAFIEAHHGRYRYRPMRGQRRGNDDDEEEAVFCVYDYPELVQGFGAGSNTQQQGGAGDGDSVARETVSKGFIDLASAPTILPVAATAEEGGDVTAVFCRASLWSTARVDILFVDRPVWGGDGSWSSNLSKARRLMGSVMKPFSVLPRDEKGSAPPGEKKIVVDDEWDVQLAEGDEVTSLETAIMDAPQNDTNAGGNLSASTQGILLRVLQESAYDNWLVLFEFLAHPLSLRICRETAACCWQMLQLLEQNADMVEYIERKSGVKLTNRIADWTRLQSRVHHRIALLSTTYSIPASSSPTTTRTASTSKKIRRVDTLNTSVRSARSANHRNTPNEHQRALDRISYLGGVVIPLPIVSGILSMGDTFGPDGPRFFVFWAVALPLAMFSLLLVYADTIRKAEVWVEIAADHVMPSSSDESLVSPHEGVPVPTTKVSTKESRVTWQKRKGSDDEEKQAKEPLAPPPQSEQHPPTLPPIIFPHSISTISIHQNIEERVTNGPLAAAENERYTVNSNANDDDTDASDDDVEDGRDMEQVMSAPEFVRVASAPPAPLPQMIIELPADGSKPKAWKRQQLGWYGAMKSVIVRGKLRMGNNTAPPGLNPNPDPGNPTNISLSLSAPQHRWTKPSNVNAISPIPFHLLWERDDENFPAVFLPPAHHCKKSERKYSKKGDMEPPTPSTGLLVSPPELSPTEHELLEEYERLAANMKKLASVLDNLASQPTSQILDMMRELERKTSLVLTLLKASVYSIVLQQQIDWGDGGGDGGGGREGDAEK
ncbi:hypothetical protein B0H63DRAFT_521192 [Podospora didyma]|uniref:DASH complex subunit DAD3 n=1 Tax=Podospora didyma TaxID=330526 RepID=A0AAE0NSZ3_9PEZI|nr:hypothetical protein B0H63DRAFT_521192 [Podospora didyma]